MRAGIEEDSGWDVLTLIFVSDVPKYREEVQGKKYLVVNKALSNS